MGQVRTPNSDKFANGSDTLMQNAGSDVGKHDASPLGERVSDDILNAIQQQLHEMKQKMSETADQLVAGAKDAVGDTVEKIKARPLLAAAIGVGIIGGLVGVAFAISHVAKANKSPQY